MKTAPEWRERHQNRRKARVRDSLPHLGRPPGPALRMVHLGEEEK
jgi:hypothetical protein